MNTGTCHFEGASFLREQLTSGRDQIEVTLSDGQGAGTNGTRFQMETGLL